MSRTQKQKIDAKKKTIRSSQAATDRVQILRSEYWERVKKIDPNNLIFLDEMGVRLGLTRTYARSRCGMVYDLKPFYRGAKVTVVGAISLTKIVGLMTLNGSMDGKAFKVFIEHFLVQNLWDGAVVVMDNLPAHKLALIEPLIQSAGASVLNLSPYSPDFNPIELWWSQSNCFFTSFLANHYKNG